MKGLRQLESRMRENRTSGSEGGGAALLLSLPLLLLLPRLQPPGGRRVRGRSQPALRRLGFSG